MYALTRSSRVNHLRWVSTLLIVLLLAAALPGESAAQRAPASPERSFADALRLYNDRHYMQAAEAFATFRRHHPNAVHAPETFYYEAQAMLALDRQAQAVRLLTQLQRTYPSHPRAREARLSLGQYFVEAGQYERARQTLEAVASDYANEPEAARARYQLGQLARDRENLTEALAQFQRVVRDYPDADMAPAALYAVGTTQVRLERFDAAAASFERLGRTYPQSPYARTLGLALADVYYELGDYERVVDEVTSRLPNLEGDARDRATFLLAEAYNHLRDHENAIVHYRRFTEDNPDSPYYHPALYGLAWNYHYEGSYQWAADHFARVQAGPDDDLSRKATYYEAANRYLDGQQQEALALYREYVRTWPKAPLADQAQYEIGMLLYNQRNWQAANDAFTTLIDQYTGSSRRGEAYYMRGNTFIALNQFDRALQSFDAAVQFDAAPDSLKQEVIFQRAWLQYDTGAYQAAAPAFLQIYNSDAAPPRRTADALFWGAESYFQMENLDRAQSLFRTYLNQYRSGDHVAAAQYALAWTYFKQQRYQQAAQAFQQFLAMDATPNDDSIPYRQDARLRLADSYYALKRYPEAVRIYRQVDGNGADYALYQTGQALDLADRSAEAIEALQRLVDQYPDSPWRDEAMYQIGAIHFQNQEFDAAIDAYERLLSAYPDAALAAKAQYSIGDAHFNAGNLDASVNAYRRVLNEYTESPFVSDAASSIQYALIAMDDPERAEAIIDSFATARPNSRIVDELRFRLAEATYQSGQTDEALSSLRRFVRTSSDDQLLPEAYYYMGQIYAERDQYEEAQGYLRQVVFSYDQGAHRAEAALQLGDLYMRQEQYDRARRAYAKMAEVAEDPATLAQARYGESMALLELGQTAEARTLLEQALDQAGDTRAAYPIQLGLGRVYERQGQLQQAEDLYRSVVRNAEGEPGAEALYRLGSLLIDRDQLQTAIAELSRMSTLYTGYPAWMAQGFLLQARAYRRLGETGEAARLYDRVIQSYADTPYAQTARTEKEAL